MKTIKNTLVIALALTLVSFTTGLVNKEVKVKNSTITWTGHKLTGKHEGTINLKEGTLTLDAKKLVAANFTIDMTSINTTDLEGEQKANLDGHLKSADFFNVSEYPTATFKTTAVSLKGKEGNYTVTGDMTIKGITHPITFNMNVTEHTATAKLKVNRAKYKVKYGSSSFYDNLKDKVISDEFDLDIKLSF
ncbi:YceI family protein [Pontimicrobium sp. MEBiC01747]